MKKPIELTQTNRTQPKQAALRLAFKTAMAENLLAFLLLAPTGISLADTLFVANTLDRNIMEFDASGAGTVFTSVPGEYPRSLAFDSAGNLYASYDDSVMSSWVYKYNSLGGATPFVTWPSGAARGLAFDGAGNLYVVNMGDNTILKYNSSGVGTVFANSGMSKPGALAIDSAGNLYVDNADNNTIVKYNSLGVGTVFASSGLNAPEGMAFDSAGNLYVANAANNTIVKFDSSGVGTVFANSGLDWPVGLAFDSAGNLYVANAANNTIVKFGSSGVGTVFASSGLNAPEGIAFKQPSTPGLDYGLVAHYTFDGNANDSTTNGNNGTAVNTSAVADRFGQPQSAYYFNGSAYVVIPHSPSLDNLGNTLTLAAWLNIDPSINYSVPDIVHILSKGATYATLWSDFALQLGNPSNGMFPSPPGSLVFENSSSQNNPIRINSTVSVPQGSWHHVAATFNSGLVTFYLDGTAIGTATSPYQSIRSSTQPLYIGVRYIPEMGYGTYFYGAMDDVRIYNRALSAAEVQQLHGAMFQLTGRIYSSTGAGIAGASVEVGSALAISSGDGSYSITSLSAGNYPVTVSAQGYTTLTTSMTVPGSGAISQNFTLSPASSTPSGTVPTVTRVTTQYSPNGEALYFLDGVTFVVPFTANVDWAGHAPGSVWFITTRGGTTSVPFTGNTASQQIDVGSAFGPGGQLQVQAVSSDGTFSVATVGNFAVMSQIPFVPFRAVDDGSHFYYESTLGANLQLFNDFLPSGVSVNSDIPIFGDNPLGLSYVPSLDTTVKANIAGFVLQVSSSNFPSLDLAGMEFDLTPTVGIAGTYNVVAAQWQWSGSIGVNAYFSQTNTWPFVVFAGPVPIPMYANVTLDLSADAALSVLSLDPISLQGTLNLDPSITGALGVGFDSTLAVEGWITGGVDLQFQYPQPPNLDSYEIYITGGVTVYGLLFTWNDHLLSWQWQWPNQSFRLHSAGTLGPNPSTVAQPYPRDYVSRPLYGAFRGHPTSGVHPLGLTGGGPQNALTYPLQAQIFPFSEPAVGASGTNCYAVWLCDNTNRSPNNRTMLLFSHFNETNWSKPAAVADDGTADFHPQLRVFADGSAAVAWENEGTLLLTNADFTAMTTNLEIATSIYDPVAGTWQPQQQLTANGYLDRTPRIAGPSVNNLMLVWVANTNNDLEGSAASVNQLYFATWSGSAWSAPEAFADVPYPLLKYDVSYDGTNAYVVMSLDADNTLTNVNAHELFEVAYQNGSWGGLQQLTTNQVPDDNPQMAIDPNGHIVLVWLQGNTLTSVVDFNFANQRVAATNQYSSNLGNFRLANSSDGRLAIIWAAPSPQYSSDLWGMFYDPNFGIWGSPHQLTADPETEMETAATFYGTNQLIALYDRLDLAIGDTNQIGSAITNADLYVLQYVLTNDLALVANSLTVSPANPAPGDTATLSVTGENLGDSAVSNVLVAFFQGDPANGGTEIGQTNIAVLMPPGASDVVSIPWTVPATTNPLTIYAVIDPYQQYPQSDLQNEEVNNTFVEPDLALQSLAWGQITSNLLSVTATVINEGTIASQPATVSFTLNSLTGTNLFSTSIVSLAPDQSVDVNFTWNVPSLGSGLSLFAVVYTGTNADFNPQNDAIQMTIEPNITAVNVQFGPITVLSNGAVQVSMTGLAGQTYLIEVSTNQVDWSTLTEVTLTNGVGQFLDTSTNNFYQAVVLSQAQPQLGAPQFLSGAAQISVTGLAGQTYVIEGSTDLVNWLPIYTNGGSFMFADTNATNYQQRFFRAVIP